MLKIGEDRLMIGEYKGHIEILYTKTDVISDTAVILQMNSKQYTKI